MSDKVVKVPEKCSGKISGSWRSRPCRAKGKVERDGQWFCGRHDPEAIKQRRAKQDAKWVRERQDKKDRLHAPCREREQKLAAEIKALRVSLWYAQRR